MDLQRIVAFVVFSFSLLMLWEAWQQYNNPTVPVAPAAQTTGQQTAAANPALPTPGEA